MLMPLLKNINDCQHETNDGVSEDNGTRHTLPHALVESNMLEISKSISGPKMIGHHTVTANHAGSVFEDTVTQICDIGSKILRGSPPTPQFYIKK